MILRQKTSRVGVGVLLAAVMLSAYAADTRHLDDVTRALDAHDRQRCLRHPQGTKKVRLELRTHLFLGQFLDHTEVTVANVVDDEVECAEVVGGSFHRIKVVTLIGDVELKG